MKRMLNALMLCLVFCLVSNGVLVSAYRANINPGISPKKNLQGSPLNMLSQNNLIPKAKGLPEPLNMLPNPLEVATAAVNEGSATVTNQFSLGAVKQLASNFVRTLALKVVAAFREMVENMVALIPMQYKVSVLKFVNNLQALLAKTPDSIQPVLNEDTLRGNKVSIANSGYNEEGYDDNGIDDDE
ncbi:hypothetical protein M8J77_024130 [Diaphorina citri]|nr:hypothetical protein M8J77_024130 [Diaphorina citri]